MTLQNPAWWAEHIDTLSRTVYVVTETRGSLLNVLMLVVNGASTIAVATVAVMELRRNRELKRHSSSIAMRRCALEAQGIIGRAILVQLNAPQVAGTIHVRSHLRPLADKVRESVNDMLEQITSLPAAPAEAVDQLHRELRALERLLEQWTHTDESLWPMHELLSGHGMQRVEQIRAAAAAVVKLCDPWPPVKPAPADAP